MYTAYAFISIPLHKERNPLVKELLNELVNSSFIINKKSIHPSQDLHFNNLQYYGHIKIGEPKGQSFKVSFTTLSTSIYVPSIAATLSCGPKNHKTFIETDSKTFKATGNVTDNNPLPYTSLKEGYDTVEVDGFAVTGQQILLILDGKCDGLVYDGVVGIGFSDLNKNPSLLANLYKNKRIPQYVVGLSLNRNPKCRNQCGEIVFGGWNSTNVNTKSLSYIDAVRYPYTSNWKIVLNQVLIGSREIVRNRYALIDTSSSFIWLPKSEIKIIENATHMIPYNSFYLLDKLQVKNLPSLTFSIGGLDYTLNGEDYVDTVDDVKGLSIVLIRSNEGLQIPKDTWILGTAFVGKYYTILDYTNRKVAFATKSGCSLVAPLPSMILLIFFATVIKVWTS